MSILLVDDSPMQRLALSSILRAEGCDDELLEASSVPEAFERLEAHERSVDLVLMDLQMPGLDGIEGCRRIKSEAAWRDLPVIMITGSAETGDLKEAFAVGAMDYITKPPNAVELLARVRSALKLKAEMDVRKARELDLSREREKAERLLLNVLPEPIAERLKQSPGVIADSFPEATVVFADIVGFTTLAARRAPAQVVEMLNEVFSRFDALASHHGLSKIKTIGDGYMAVAGVPTPRADHAEAVAEMALDMREALRQALGGAVRMRIGIHSGPVIAGVIGTQRFSYDLWGDTVNLASRMESQGSSGRIQITRETYERLEGRYVCESRGLLPVKGLGEVETWWLMARAA